jgi:hypothetical protein
MKKNLLKKNVCVCEFVRKRVEEKGWNGMSAGGTG